MIRPAVIFAWLVPLVALQGVPHTGALRTLFLLLGIVHLLLMSREKHIANPLPLDRSVLAVFWLLTAWLAAQSFFVDAGSLLVLQTLASQWGKLLLMALVGITLVRMFPDWHWIALAFFCGAFIHVLSTWGAQLLSLTQGHGLAYGQSLLSEYPVASSFTTVAFVWLLSDGISRIWHGKHILPWSPRVSVLLMLMTLSAEAVLKAKSEQVMALLLIGLACLLLIKCGSVARRWKIGLFFAGFVLAGILIGAGSNRWVGLGDSLHAAWQQPFSPQVLVTDAVPLPANINHSIYMRAIRGKIGVEGIAEHPLGLGYFPDVFGRYVTGRFGFPEAIDSSNSGLIDFGLAAGIPGIGLLLLLAGQLIHRGWSAFLAGHPLGIVLALLVFHQIGRYAIDGTLGGSRFTGFALIAATLWALTARNEKQSPSS